MSPRRDAAGRWVTELVGFSVPDLGRADDYLDWRVVDAALERAELPEGFADTRTLLPPISFAAASARDWSLPVRLWSFLSTPATSS